MATAKKKSTKQAAIPAHPAVAHPKEIGEICADVYGHAVKLARQQGVDEQMVEQIALGEIRSLMSACMRQARADWKAYSKATGVIAAYVQAKGGARKSAGKPAKKKATRSKAA